MEQDRCTHIALSLPAWFRCPRPRLSWQHARTHEMSWEYVHISNMTLDEVGEQAFHDGRLKNTTVQTAGSLP